MVSWNKICRPKKYGRLGFRKTEATNKAFLSKLGWRTLNDDGSLWVKIVKDKYLLQENFLDRKNKNTDSRAWKMIANSRELLKQGLRWKLGNGKKINF